MTTAAHAIYESRSCRRVVLRRGRRVALPSAERVGKLANHIVYGAFALPVLPGALCLMGLALCVDSILKVCRA